MYNFISQFSAFCAHVHARRRVEVNWGAVSSTFVKNSRFRQLPNYETFSLHSKQQSLVFLSMILRCLNLPLLLVLSQTLGHIHTVSQANKSGQFEPSSVRDKKAHMVLSIVIGVHPKISLARLAFRLFWGAGAVPGILDSVSARWYKSKVSKGEKRWYGVEMENTYPLTVLGKALINSAWAGEWSKSKKGWYEKLSTFNKGNHDKSVVSTQHRCQTKRRKGKFKKWTYHDWQRISFLPPSQPQDSQHVISPRPWHRHNIHWQLLRPCQS